MSARGVSALLVALAAAAIVGGGSRAPGNMAVIPLNTQDPRTRSRLGSPSQVVGFRIQLCVLPKEARMEA
jgi:hypothetical protein